VKTIVLSGLVARSPRPGDLPAVRALLAACAQAEGNEESDRDQQEELQSIWQRPDFHLQSDACLILSRWNQTVGYGAIWPEQPASRRFRLSVHVHPEYRHRGIGTLLLRLIEQRARTLIVEAALPEATLVVAVAEANLAARELLEREGYRLLKSFWRIVIDLLDSPAAWPADGRLTLELDEHPRSPTEQQPSGRSALVGRWCLYEKCLHADSRPGQSEASLVSRDSLSRESQAE
jgi:ribosomal protein S18 acetylase RimI-like enzyme